MALTNLSINNIYNTPKVTISGVTTLKNILLAHGVINKQVFIDYITKLDNNEDVSSITNIITFNSIEAVNKYKCTESGFYTLFIRNTDDEVALSNFMSTFPIPEIIVIEEDKKIKITISSELEVTTIKIANGYVDSSYFVNNGDRLPITSTNQKEFIFQPANLYGKYTVYVTMRTGLYTTKQFLIGSNFLSKNEIIENTDNKYYALLTDYASRDLERFYNNLNVVYPLVADTRDNQELTDLLSNKTTIKRSNLIYYNKYATKGYFEILKKYIDGANLLTMQINIPVSLENTDTYFIYGFIVYSETESAPMIIYKLDEPIRKENTVNTDIKLPLSIILTQARSNYPDYIFDDANDLVTKSYLDQVLSTYNDKYAYADKSIITDLQNRINYKFSDVDPELQELKNIADTVNATKAEILEALEKTKNDTQDYADQIYEQVENYLNQTKKDIEELTNKLLANLQTARDQALTDFENTKNNVVQLIQGMVSATPVEVVLTKIGLYKFLEIPNNDADKHEFIFDVVYPDTSRKLYFYVDIYTSKLNAQANTLNLIPYLDFPFISTNTDKFSDSEIGGPYGISFIVSKEANNTIIYLYISEPTTITYGGKYKIVPNIDFVSTEINALTDYQNYKIGAGPFRLLTLT